MKRNFDFHVHTNASDGSCTPAELVKLASDEGIEFLAVTDHDTVSGVEEAVAAGREFGVTVIPGVEMSIDFGPGTFHLCGYGIDIHDSGLTEALDFVQDSRKNRNRLIVEKLNSIGVEISLDEVFAAAGADQVGRPHFARVILDKGYAESFQDVFDRFLARGKPGYVEKKRLKIEDAVAVIRGAGGVAVLAHPVQLQLGSNGAYRDYLSMLKEQGVEGVEVCSSCHSADDNTFFTDLADELGLMKTAGSDFHGEINPGVKLGVFGDSGCAEAGELLERLGG